MGDEFKKGECPVCNLGQPLPKEYCQRFEFSIGFADKEITKCCALCNRVFRVLRSDLNSKFFQDSIKEKPEIAEWSLHKRKWRPTIEEVEEICGDLEKLEEIKKKFNIY